MRTRNSWITKVSDEKIRKKQWKEIPSNPAKSLSSSLPYWYWRIYMVLNISLCFELLLTNVTFMWLIHKVRMSQSILNRQTNIRRPNKKTLRLIEANRIQSSRVESNEMKQQRSQKRWERQNQLGIVSHRAHTISVLSFLMTRVNDDRTLISLISHGLVSPIRSGSMDWIRALNSASVRVEIGSNGIERDRDDDDDDDEEKEDAPERDRGS